MSTAIMVAAGVALWVATGAFNFHLYGRLIGHDNAYVDRDLLVSLGPSGTFMLLLYWGLNAFLKLCARLNGVRP